MHGICLLVPLLFIPALLHQQHLGPGFQVGITLSISILWLHITGLKTILVIYLDDASNPEIDMVASAESSSVQIQT